MSTRPERCERGGEFGVVHGRSRGTSGVPALVRWIVGPAATLVLLTAPARADEASSATTAMSPPVSTPGPALSLIDLPPNLRLVSPGTSAPAPASRPTHRLEWDPRWHRFRIVEYVTTGVTGIAAIGVFYFVKPSEEAHWVGPILFDTAVRNALRLHTRSGLEAAATASYVTAVIPPAQALVDSLILPAVDRNFDLMWQLGMMDAQSFAFSALVTTSLYDTVGRARPSYLDCKSGKSVDPLCNSGEFASFPSGHTSAAMTGAGLICAHHGALPLYGGGPWDVAACVEGLTVATGVGVLRMMADRHYLSDVLVGGAIGFFSGYALPRLLHYWKRPLGEVVSRDDLKVAIVPGAGATPIGAQIMGVF
jgi:membrane-associated phospholipid phosphatase